MLLVSLWLASVGNLPLWLELDRLGLLQGRGGPWLGAGLMLAIAAALMALQSLLAWRHTLKGTAIALLLIAAAGGYFMHTYHVVIDPAMMLNVAQTDVHEAGDLIGPRLLLALALAGGLPALWVWRQPLHYRPWPRRALHNLALLLAALLLLLGAVLASYQPLSSAMRNHKHVRYLINPLTTLFSGAWVASAPLRQRDARLHPVGEDAHLAANPPAPAGPGALGALGLATAQAATASPAAGRSPLVVLVLGETARAANFGLNGYARDTTPALAREGTVLSFRQVRSCGTSTAASLPCMFSHLGREGFVADPRRHENVLDVLQRAGLAVLWLDNQGGCKGVCERVPHASTADALPTGVPPYPAGTCAADGECFDTALLHGLDARLAAAPGVPAAQWQASRARGTVLVLHMMGSHGPAYYKRSPPELKRFGPECASTTLPDCSREQVLNAYDNSIAATDAMLAATIDWLKRQSAQHDTALVYLSDHGESLGENGLYLHGLPYAMAPDVQKQVPWLTWLSPAFAARQQLDAACLAARADQPLSHDHLFHSLLGLAAVQTRAYLPALDAYAACRR
ncbi:phosphoethanolamine transferase [Aquabacterium sp. OR-4]|uniref:phosphoethanolamine transferase n=1 Tax=Aquabacterium sp. OR-4 TaxID=2978127 RepID=UPI0028C511AC|nr:sulfatase-like hydrolase/transferase [Aquabacterium sp. OR-4]MDT7834301.1 phosphoethanolamine transferase domain-containing protein [Aquabacterium sp. OR-4]